MTRTLQITTFACLLSVVVTFTAASTRPNLIQKAFLRAGGGKKLREEVVAKYFDGVDKQNREQIVTCFNPSGIKIRDVCGVSKSERLATPEQLGDRCMEFLAAHPDCKVMFHHPYVVLIANSLFLVLLDVLLTNTPFISDQPAYGVKVGGYLLIGTKKELGVENRKESSQVVCHWTLKDKPAFW